MPTRKTNLLWMSSHSGPTAVPPSRKYHFTFSLYSSLCKSGVKFIKGNILSDTYSDVAADARFVCDR